MNIKIMKKNFILGVLIAGALLVMIVSIYVPFFVKNDEVVKKITKNDQVLGECINEDANVSYKFEKKERPLANVVVHVADKNTAEEKQSFKIDDIFENYHPVELHKCRVYVIRMFNYNPKRSQQDPGFMVELWEYQYNGSGSSTLLLAEEDKNGIYKGNYSYDFRIDPSEKYLALIRGYGGKDDYSLVIKDLKTLNDALVLPFADIVKQNPDVVGDIGFENSGWSSDGRYFWFLMEQTADIVGFVRVDTKDWSYKIFPTPQRTMGGDAFNINTGIVTYGADVAPWSGVVEIDAQLQKEAIQNGQISSFYIYNLFTKQKYLVATTTDPTYYFRPRWISDSELQYELPSGEKNIYKVIQKQ